MNVSRITITCFINFNRHASFDILKFSYGCARSIYLHRKNCNKIPKHHIRQRFNDIVTFEKDVTAKETRFSREFHCVNDMGIFSHFKMKSLVSVTIRNYYNLKTGLCSSRKRLFLNFHGLKVNDITERSFLGIFNVYG